MKDLVKVKRKFQAAVDDLKKKDGCTEKEAFSKIFDFYVTKSGDGGDGVTKAAADNWTKTCIWIVVATALVRMVLQVAGRANEMDKIRKITLVLWEAVSELPVWSDIASKLPLVALLFVFGTAWHVIVVLGKFVGVFSETKESPSIPQIFVVSFLLSFILNL